MNGKAINFVTGSSYTRVFPTHIRYNNLPNSVLYNTFWFTKHFIISFNAREILIHGSLSLILSFIAVSFPPFSRTYSNINLPNHVFFLLSIPAWFLCQWRSQKKQILLRWFNWGAINEAAMLRDVGRESDRQGMLRHVKVSDSQVWREYPSLSPSTFHWPAGKRSQTPAVEAHLAGIAKRKAEDGGGDFWH